MAAISWDICIQIYTALQCSRLLMVCYHHVLAFRAIHCPSPHVGLQGAGWGGGGGAGGGGERGGGRGSRAKGDGVGKGRGGVEACRLWGEYRRAVLGTSESVGINRQIDWQLTYAHRSRWSIAHQRPLAIALSSGLLWPFQTSWSLAVSALLQCLASNCCEAGLSFSSPVGSRSGFGV